jgi:DnaK suppressor protein
VINARSSKLEFAAELLTAERAGCLARLSRLHQDFAGVVESGSGGSDDEHDPEGATLAYEREHLAALISDASRRLAQIDAAVRRLHDGTYGTCQNCGQPISAARLSARPTAAACVSCPAQH